MEKYKYDENNGLWYEVQGDCYLPCLKLPEEERVHISIWGQRHLSYLRENKRALLFNLQISGRLNSYLADVDRQVEEMVKRLTRQIATAEGVTEQLKVTDQMAWVGKMNNIRNRAMENANNEIVFNQ